MRSSIICILRQYHQDDDVACKEAKGNKFRVLVSETEGKRPLGRPRRRKQNNIKMNC
jgi:hypothetical protein